MKLIHKQLKAFSPFRSREVNPQGVEFILTGPQLYACCTHPDFEPLADDPNGPDVRITIGVHRMQDLLKALQVKWADDLQMISPKDLIQAWENSIAEIHTCLDGTMRGLLFRKIRGTVFMCQDHEKENWFQLSDSIWQELGEINDDPYHLLALTRDLAFPTL